MKRPDLNKGNSYDGWQVLDPTPQEKSEGEHNFVFDKCTLTDSQMNNCKTEYTDQPNTFLQKLGQGFTGFNPWFSLFKMC